MTAAGLLTLLWGGAYAVLGGALVFAGVGGVRQPEGDAGGFGWLLQIVAGVTAAVGVAFLLAGAAGVLAGSGVLSRRRWGRVLTLVVSALATLSGVGWVAGGDWDATDLALGAGQFLYGTFALVVMVRGGAEFSPPRPDRTGR
ncbi:MAG: hypothetical protein JWO38_4099 [Gemmataceae bacterium]|nr:hypothetical protein [Gemmataceae bacterium]